MSGTTRRGFLGSIAAGAGAAAAPAASAPAPDGFVEMMIRCSGGPPDRPCTETRRMAVYNDPELGSTELPRFVCDYHRERQSVERPVARFFPADGGLPETIRSRRDDR